MNLFSLAKAFPTEEDALAYWIKARWPDGVKCLGCGHGKVYQIATKNKSGKIKTLFECADCGLHFSPTVGTIFHDSHLPLQKWFAAIALMCEAKKGISANQLKRHIGVTYKTAWFLAHRIRHAMQENADIVLGGVSKTVEIDETFVGGRATGRGVKAGISDKTIVVGLAERNGRIHLQTVPNRKIVHMKPLIEKRLDSDTPIVVTDSAAVYSHILPKEKHIETNHKEEIRTAKKLSTQTVESAFSLFKRGIVGNYHKLSVEHLDRYLGEFCWRYNRRHLQPMMFDMTLKGLATKKPLPYKVLTFDGF